MTTPPAGARADHVGLLALRLGLFLGAGAVVRILIGGEAPFADQLVGTNGRRHFGPDSRLDRSRRGPAAQAEAGAGTKKDRQRRDNRKVGTRPRIALTDHGIPPSKILAA